MAKFTGAEASASSIILGQKVSIGASFKKWDFQIIDDKGNIYSWEETDEKLNYASTPTETQVSTYVHAYLSAGSHGDSGGTYAGVEKITTTVAKPVTANQSLYLLKPGAVPEGSKPQLAVTKEDTLTTAYGPVGTFIASDTTPDVSAHNYYETDTGTLTITDFDNGTHGQHIYVISKGAITYDVTSTNLKGGSTNIVTADGDMTCWIYIGGSWYLTNFMDVSANLTGGH
tara:strand:+ start:528 stop:1214 length:687 start_codon:yes stop_codon:yes gene_type:complete